MEYYELTAYDLIACLPWKVRKGFLEKYEVEEIEGRVKCKELEGAK